jgi:hypothetical protein
LLDKNGGEVLGAGSLSERFLLEFPKIKNALRSNTISLVGRQEESNDSAFDFRPICDDAVHVAVCDFAALCPDGDGI